LTILENSAGSLKKAREPIVIGDVVFKAASLPPLRIVSRCALWPSISEYFYACITTRTIEIL
jgi:hypothetical protein